MSKVEFRIRDDYYERFDERKIELAENFRDILGRLGLSIGDFCEMMGVTRQTFWYWTSGQTLPTDLHYMGVFYALEELGLEYAYPEMYKKLKPDIFDGLKLKGE